MIGVNLKIKPLKDECSVNCEAIKSVSLTQWFKVNTRNIQ